MAERKRRSKRDRPRTPAVVNKAPDLLPDREWARFSGWLGQGYRPPPGPPWPWEILTGEARELFDGAVKRLTVGGVPPEVASVICWSDGGWHKTCRMIAEAAEVQVFPDRQHIRLVPRASWYTPPPKQGTLPS